jgi:hypothetical protein
VPIDAESLARHYEQDDVDVRGLVRFAIAIAIGATIASGVLWLVVRMWTAQPLPLETQIAPAAVTAPAVPGPGLDALPEATLTEIIIRDNERLTTYGWVDREAGTVRIPIDEAMRLLVERGVPAREGDAPDFGLEPAFRLDGSGGTLPAGSEGTEEAGSDE